MRIRLKRQYLQWPAGSVVELPSGVAQTLIAVGKAELDQPETEKRLRSPRNKALHGAEVKHGTR